MEPSGNSHNTCHRRETGRESIVLVFLKKTCNPNPVKPAVIPIMHSGIIRIAFMATRPRQASSRAPLA